LTKRHKAGYNIKGRPYEILIYFLLRGNDEDYRIRKSERRRGKTTAAINLADGLARSGVRTLLVDLDPQGHVALSLGLEKSPGIYRLICLQEKLVSLVQSARPNLDILPSDKRTERAKREITLSDFREVDPGGAPARRLHMM
jgi:hypothetical protein